MAQPGTAEYFNAIDRQRLLDRGVRDLLGPPVAPTPSAAPIAPAVAVDPYGQEKALIQGALGASLGAPQPGPVMLPRPLPPSVESVAPAAAAPRAVGYAPAVPDYTAYLPAGETPGQIDALRSGIETDRLQGRITSPQARARRAGLEGFRRSPVGLAAEQEWLGQESAGRRFGIERELQGELQASEDEIDDVRTELAFERDRLARQAEAEHVASRKAIDDRMGRVDRLNAELAATKVDPQRFWKNQHPVQSIMSILGVALGGLAEGMSGGKIKSRAVEMLQAHIDRDINAQMADLETRKGAIAGERSAIGIARERLADRDAEYNFMRQNLANQAADTVERQAHMMKDAERRAALKGVAEDLRAQGNQSAMALKANALAYAERARLAARLGAQGARPKKANADMQARYVKALGGFAPDAKTAERLNKASANNKILQANLVELKQLGATGQMWNPLGNDRAKADTLIIDTQMRLKDGMALGTYDKGSAELLNKYVRKLPYLVDTGELASYDALSRGMQHAYDQQVASESVIPGTMRTVEDGKGGYETVYEIDPNAKPQGRAVTVNPVEGR